MSKIRTERKFRRYRGGLREHCDNCGREIAKDEWVYSRRDKYRILRSKYSIFNVPLVRTIQETTLCKDCVPEDKVVKRDRKFLTGEVKK